MQDGLIRIAFIIITIIANRRGLSDAAAVGIVEKIISFLFLVPSSMLSTVSALGAQNIGAGKPERAAQTLKYAAMIAVGFGLTVAIIIQFYCRTRCEIVYHRCGSPNGRRTVYPRIYLGLHFCRGTFQFQWLFLCRFCIISLRSCWCAYRVFILHRNCFRRRFSHGTGNRCRLTSVSDHLCHSLSADIQKSKKKVKDCKDKFT